MPKLTIIFGVALIALGVGAYFAAPADARSVTAFIPAFVGVPILICGLLAMKPSLRKGAMHVAVAIGGLGLIASFSRIVTLLTRGESIQFNLATGVQLAMAGLTGAFVVLCVRSFMQARKTGAAGAA